tara:strand:- start:17 stop:1084 length:1068 start_codon:yes stop_codon:yes gene_type:complete
MNYKVMKRPMFKMGGKAASQGTGITSGLDNKVDMAIGGGVIQGDNLGEREGFQDPDYKTFLRSAFDKYNRRQENMSSMEDLINLQALGKASQVLGGVESNNPFDILQNIAMSGTEIALPALSAKKSLQMKLDDPATDLAFAKALKPDSSGFSTKLKSQAALKLIQQDINKLRQSLTQEGANKDLINRQIGELQEQKRIFLSGNPYLEAVELYYKFDMKGKSGIEPSAEDLEKYLKFTGGNAMGGTPNRVNRAMGSGDEGELPADPTEPVNPFKPKPIKPLGDGKMDVAMETQSQGNNVYDMLRARLPQEISDEVVKLIAYNKEAFGDFASIKNQEDVTSFNEKYNVELVIDVATV